MSNYKIFSSIDGLRDMTDIEKTQHDKDIAKSLGTDLNFFVIILLVCV